MVEKLRQVFFAAKQSSYSKHMHVLELPQPNGPEHEINILGLAGYAQHSGFVVIMRDNAAQAENGGMDGILLNTAEEIEAARAVVGNERIIGVQCGGDRQLAEKALAHGADYVTFSNPITLLDDIAWWTTKSDFPVLADVPVTNDNCAPYVRVGATFVNATGYILDHPKGIMQGTVDMLYAIDLATKGRIAN